MEKYFFEAFAPLDRQGPGSEKSTQKAIQLLPLDHQAKYHILDIGCGKGIHTLHLLEEFPHATVTAVDIDETSLDILRLKMVEGGFENRLEIKQLSMFDQLVPDESVDLIWAEGSIYIMGFHHGLREWHRYLKPGGMFVCSEISWLHSHPSQAAQDFWKENYTEMDTIPTKIHQIEQAGYRYHYSFALPQSDWEQEYYAPLEISLKSVLFNHPNDPEAKRVAHMLTEEIQLYRKHPNDYSYVFYGMQKPLPVHGPIGTALASWINKVTTPPNE